MTRTCCFTGHRVLPDHGSEDGQKLIAALSDAVRDAMQEGCTRFAIGGAIGFDLLAGEWILALKKVEPSVTLAVYIPHRGQANAFPPADMLRYQRVLNAADETILVSETYRPGCMRLRNARMVQDADLCIAYVRKSKSGSAQTMQMAERKGIPVLRL